MLSELKGRLDLADQPPKRPDRPGTPGPDTSPGEAPTRERRSLERVADDQKTGRGALSALSKLRMLERRRAALQPMELPDEKPPPDKPSR